MQSTPISAAHIIAQTICECEGKDWISIGCGDRDRFYRIGVLAEDRIRTTALPDNPGLIACHSGDHPSTVTSLQNAFASD